MEKVFPPFLQPKSPLVPKEMYADIEAAMGNDRTAFCKTNVLVHGASLSDIEDCLKSTWYAIDCLKITSGVVPIRNDIPEILSIAKKYGVRPYIGGLVLESAVAEKSLPALIREFHRLEIDTVEMSDSNGTTTDAAFRALYKSLQKDFDRVIVEIGSKERSDVRHEAWIRELQRALDTDSDDIVLEGGGAGDCGIYTPESQPKTLLVAELFRTAKREDSRLIIEAPDPSQQVSWLSIFGWNTRLANVSAVTPHLTNLIQMRLRWLERNQVERTKENRKALLGFSKRIRAACERLDYDFDRLVNDPDLSNLPVSNWFSLGILERSIIDQLKDIDQLDS